MKTKIETILKNVLPSKTNIIVSERKYNFGNEPYLMIAFSVSNHQINNVSGQYPQIVSLILNLQTLELKPQIFGGNGGQSIYLIPDKNNIKEKYLAMASYKIPFRTPKKEEKFVLSTVQKFAENWLNALKENKERLMYQNYVNYEEFFNS